MAHHGRARHLAEGADVRQSGRAVAGLEDDGLVLPPGSLSRRAIRRRASSKGQARACGSADFKSSSSAKGAEGVLMGQAACCCPDRRRAQVAINQRATREGGTMQRIMAQWKPYLPNSCAWGDIFGSE
jgi:hypothetical protein